MNWPKISVIVPSYNQERFIEATLRSILDQNYPNLELIVIDGGSKDASVDIIRKYQDRIAYWVSEPDGGQTRGLIKGFNRSTGDIQCWINSDDLLRPGSLREVGEYFLKHPGADMVYGDTLWIDGRGEPIAPRREIPFNRALWMYTYNYIPGMSAFWRKPIYDRVGGLNPEFDLSMDADLWIRFAAAGARIKHLRRLWSCMRFYAEQKNTRLRDKTYLEDLRIRERYWGTARPALYSLKRRLAMAVRTLWRIAWGCYSPKNKIFIEPPSVAGLDRAMAQRKAQ
jgi:glycosyltransferase involved in cell wall biosynthesis